MRSLMCVCVDSLVAHIENQMKPVDDDVNRLLRRELECCPIYGACQCRYKTNNINIAVHGNFIKF